MTLSFRAGAVQTAFCLLLLALALLAESRTGLDILVQRQWYDAVRGTWLIDAAAHNAWRRLFYDGMKRGVAAVGVLSVLLFVAGLIFRRRAWVRAGLLLSLSCAATPLLVASLKAVTGIYCPRQLALFGGDAPYRHLFSASVPASGGRCFPGGHASGGFALTMLFFCFSSRRAKAAALAAALALGWTMGLYQMMRGEHFLSHTVVSMLLAWQMNILLVLLVEGVLLPFLERKRGMRRRA